MRRTRITTARHLVPATLAAALLLGASSSAVDREEALRSFKIHPDFQLELIAAEPVIYDPVDVEFDERGRPFVVEMPGYPFPEVPGRVILLEDTDDDGYYETRKVFADGFPVADSLLPYDGGILVASPPDLIFLKDTNGDDVADVREVLLTGFTVDNPQHNFNGLTHGLDNWIYGANGGNGGMPQFAGDASSKVGLRFDDFRVDLRRKRLERIGRSTGGFEITMDEYGRLFGTHNLKPIRHLVFAGRYLDGLPQPHTGTLNELPDDIENGLVRIYPIGPQETRVNHPEQSGYFSGSCGITHYGGGAFGDALNGNVFICDCVLNLVHRRVLEPKGASFVAHRGRPKVEFLASTDRGFRPVNMTVAPDGSFWLLDMHRTVIEHPEWIPDELEQNMDLDAGKEAGRIYRITPKGGLPRVAPRFDPADLDSVCAALGHSNKWWRDTAQRLLVQWGDKRAVPALEQMVRKSDKPLARLHALWTLEGLDALEEKILLRALRDSDAGVRESAVLIAESVLGQSRSIRFTVAGLAADSDARVRMRVALALGALEPGDDTEDALLSITVQDADDASTRLALLPAMAKAPAHFAERLAGLSSASRDGRAVLLSSLAHVAGQQAPPDDVDRLLTLIASRSQGDDAFAVPMLRGLAAGLDARPASRPTVTATPAAANAIDSLIDSPSLTTAREAWRVWQALGLPESARLRALLRSAQSTVADTGQAPELRLEYLRLLAFAEFGVRRQLLFDLLGTQNPRVLQVEAIEQLEREGSREVAQGLIERWQHLGPDTRVKAGNVLLYRRRNNDLLLTALENGAIALGEMNLHLERRRTLLHSRDPDIRRRAEALFTDAGVVTRREAIDAMRPALALAGDAARGRAVFEELCVKCHQMGSEGGTLGPNLTEIYRKSSETLMHDILDPNAAVNNEFVSFTIERTDGEVVSGIIAEETDDAVTLRDSEDRRTTITRDEMVEMYSNGLSLMPEELESGMDPQTMADLLAYLQERK